jgi:signal transduction histidine kinase
MGQVTPGRGISEESLPRVFDRFRRGPIKISGDDSLGLGLAIARYFLEAHGGSICAHSSGLGRGSMFTVHLPFVALARSRPMSPYFEALSRPKSSTKQP